MMTPQKAYQTFSSENELPLFFQPWYLDIIYGKDQWTCSYHAEENQILAIWVYSIRQIGPFRYVALPTLIKYTGIFFAAHVKESEYSGIYQSLYNKLPNTASWIQQFSAEYQSFISENQDDFDKQSRTTYFWDLSMDETERLSLMDGNYRRAINKHLPTLKQNEGLTNSEDIERFIQLLEESMGSISGHSINKELLKKLILESEKKDQGKLMMLSDEGSLVSGSFIMWDDDTAYYLLAGNSRDFKKIYPGVLMAFSASNLLLKKGIKKLDFLGSDIESISRIWRKLGAEKKEYTLVKKEKGWFRILKKLMGK